MSCDLNRASEEFQKIIENQSTNLEYLNQLNATFQAAQENMWGKTISLATDLIDDAFGDQLGNFLEGEMSFDKIKSIIQLVALVNPGIFGECIKKEINKLEDFFKNELEFAKLIIDYFDELIFKLNNEWNILLEPNLKEIQEKQLNELMNKDLPEAGKIIRKVKNKIIAIEGEIYKNNMLSQVDRNKINLFIQELEEADNKIDPNKEDNILGMLLKMIQEWNKIKETLGKMSHPNSAKFISFKETFEEINENLKKSINDLLILLQVVRQTLMELDLTDNMMFEDWKKTINHIVKNLDSQRNYNSANILKEAIDNYIETGNTQFIELTFPLIAVPINNEKFSSWKQKADFIKLNQSNWSNHIKKSISILKNLTDSKYNNILNSFDSIYSLITDEIINAYIELTNPIWNELFRRIDEIDFILNSLIKGTQLTNDLNSKITGTLGMVNNIYNVIENQINIFTSENPAGFLANSLGLNSATLGLIQGLTNLSDFLGLDILSDKINKGDIAGVFNLSEEEADSINQFLKDLNCLEGAGENVKSAAFQIRNMVIDNQRRKENLQQTASSLLKKGIEKQEKQIEKYENLNKILKNSLN